MYNTDYKYNSAKPECPNEEKKKMNGRHVAQSQGLFQGGYMKDS